MGKTHSKKKVVILTLLITIAVIVTVIVIVLHSANSSAEANAPYAELKTALDDGTFSSSWRSSDNQRVLYKYDTRSLQIVADKLSEYHENNDVENAVDLLNNIMELGIEIDGKYIYASSNFIDWIKDNALEQGKGYIETKPAKYSWANDDHIYHYTLFEHQLRWNPEMMLNQFYMYVPFLDKDCLVMVNDTYYTVDPKVEIR